MGHRAGCLWWEAGAVPAVICRGMSAHGILGGIRAGIHAPSAACPSTPATGTERAGMGPLQQC